jgi:hypothetical protein
VDAPTVTVPVGATVFAAVAVGTLVLAALVATGFGVSVAFDPPQAARAAAAALAAIPLTNIRRERRWCMMGCSFFSLRQLNHERACDGEYGT